MSIAQTLPSPRGELTESLIRRLTVGQGLLAKPPFRSGVLEDDDAQLTLHVIYELSYRGYAGVDPAAEWDPDVVRLRRDLESAMEHELRDSVGPSTSRPVDLLRGLADGEGAATDSLSGFLAREPTLDRLREFAVHRSAYQAKEADPHSWGLPRLAGRSKSALVTIQADEYGQGQPGASHAELWAATMSSLGLDASYGAYVERLPAASLATGNLISLLGMQRRLLPALIGHLALFEMTSIGPMGRYAAALAAVGVPRRGRRFFEVHVQADAVHQVLALSDLVGGHLADHPEDAAEISFGALALDHVEARFSSQLLDAFREERPTRLELRAPCDDDRRAAT